MSMASRVLRRMASCSAASFAASMSALRWEILAMRLFSSIFCLRSASRWVVKMARASALSSSIACSFSKWFEGLRGEGEKASGKLEMRRCRPGPKTEGTCCRRAVPGCCSLD